MGLLSAIYGDEIYEELKEREKMNRYAEVKKEIQARWDAFPIGFAFSNEQLEEEMKRLGVESTDELLGIGFGGGFIRKTDKDAFHELIDWSSQRRLDELAKDKDGSGYIKDMFLYELANHEYGYTRELDDTLDALDLTMEQINADRKLKNGLKLALEEFAENEEVY